MPKVTLKWLDRAVGEEGYKIYRSEETLDINNLPAPLTTLPPNTTSFVDDTINLSTKYHYVISAFNQNKEAFSKEIVVEPIEYPLINIGSNIPVGNNNKAGFFGEVSVEDLISGSALASMIGLSSGTAQFSNEPWLKFFIDDKILFVAKKPYRCNLSWSSINARNAVYGNRILTIQGYQFRIRLLKGADSDPAEFSSGNDPVGTHNSEWNRLIYNVHQDIPDSQIGDNWANYDDSDLNITGDGSYTWCQETSSSDSSRRVYRGWSSLRRAGRAISSQNTSSYGWRPVLELVDEPE